MEIPIKMDDLGVPGKLDQCFPQVGAMICSFLKPPPGPS